MADESTLPGGNILIYSDGGLNLRVRLDGQTVWLTQRLVAELYGVTAPNVNYHLQAIYEEGALAPERTIKPYLIVRKIGDRAR